MSEINVNKDTPDYADFDSPAKFTAIQSIVAKHLTNHPNAVCSYSGGADSDILIDILEKTRKAFRLPPVKYVFFNTGLEMKAIKNHVKDVSEKYGVEIEEYQPVSGYIKVTGRDGTRIIKSKKALNVIIATRKYGIPFISKPISNGLDRWEAKKEIPISIFQEYENAEDKKGKFQELQERYPNSKWLIRFICGCDSQGNPQSGQGYLKSMAFLHDYITEFPPDFKISSRCCDYCKKNVSHEIMKNYDMFITGERKSEGGTRAIGDKTCFSELADGKFKMRPLYYVSDKDKAWYKETYGIRYSDAYEVYGLTRTGCCGCSISYKAVEDLELIQPYEPNVAKAAWNIFGKSYEYRMQYNEYKKKRMEEEKTLNDEIPGQMSLFEL